MARWRRDDARSEGEIASRKRRSGDSGGLLDRAPEVLDGRNLLEYLSPDKAVAATDGDAVLDDAATGQALLGFLHRARECGAVDDGDLQRAGLRVEELGERSFPALLAGRRG